MSALISSLCATVVAAAAPFAIVSDAVVAGIFALVNTLLNAVTIFALHRFLKGTPEKVDRAVEVLEKQESHMQKRVTDEPGVADDGEWDFPERRDQ